MKTKLKLIRPYESIWLAWRLDHYHPGSKVAFPENDAFTAMADRRRYKIATLKESTRERET